MSVSPAGAAKLNARDLFFGIACLVLFLDTATSSSAMGPTSITWYLILALIFTVPTAMVTAELGSSYPSDGGLYHWVKISLGNTCAARVSWYYWLNNAVWVASATIFVINVISEMLALLTGIVIPFPLQLFFAAALVWLYVFIACRPMRESTRLRNLGGIAKLTIVVALILCALVYLVKHGGETATPLSLGAFKPTLGAVFVFFPALIYNIMGFDAICAIAGGKIKNPGRDLPRMILLNMVILTLVYVVANLAILTVTPRAEINIITGILNCFTLTFAGNSGIALYVVVGLIFLYTSVTQGPSWMQAAAYMSAEAAAQGEFPRVFGIIGKKLGTPVGSLVLIGVVSTVFIASYGLLAVFAGNTAQELFWKLFSFTSIIFLLPYILCFSAFIKLRKTDPGTKRPFRFPGPPWLAMAAGRLDQAILIFTIALFFYVPGEPIDVIGDLSLGVGVVIGLSLGEILRRRARSTRAPH